jgi:hypothetical protein
LGSEIVVTGWATFGHVEGYGVTTLLVYRTSGVGTNRRCQSRWFVDDVEIVSIGRRNGRSKCGHRGNAGRRENRKPKTNMPT